MSSKLQVRIQGEVYTDISSETSHKMTKIPLVRLVPSRSYLEGLVGWRKQIVLSDIGKLSNQSLDIAQGSFTWNDGKGFLQPTEDWTICFWNYKTTSGLKSYIVSFFGNSYIMNGTSEENYFGLMINDKHRCVLKSNQIQTQKWYHVAFVNYNGTISLYVNGILTENTQAKYSIDLTKLKIGGSVLYSTSLLDDLIIVRQALWTGAFTPPTTYL